MEKEEEGTALGEKSVEDRSSSSSNELNPSEGVDKGSSTPNGLPELSSGIFAELKQLDADGSASIDENNGSSIERPSEDTASSGVTKDEQMRSTHESSAEVNKHDDQFFKSFSGIQDLIQSVITRVESLCVENEAVLATKYKEAEGVGLKEDGSREDIPVSLPGTAHKFGPHGTGTKETIQNEGVGGNMRQHVGRPVDQGEIQAHEFSLAIIDFNISLQLLKEAALLEHVGEADDITSGSTTAVLPAGSAEPSEYEMVRMKRVGSSFKFPEENSPVLPNILPRDSQRILDQYPSENVAGSSGQVRSTAGHSKSRNQPTGNETSLTEDISFFGKLKKLLVGADEPKALIKEENYRSEQEPSTVVQPKGEKLPIRNETSQTEDISFFGKLKKLLVGADEPKPLIKEENYRSEQEPSTTVQPKGENPQTGNESTETKDIEPDTGLPNVQLHGSSDENEIREFMEIVVDLEDYLNRCLEHTITVDSEEDGSRSIKNDHAAIEDTIDPQEQD